MQLKTVKEGLTYSIIVVSWNAVEALALCVASVYKHTKNFELIIVDNGSTDGSVGYIKNLEGLHENIKFIDNGTNLNFGPANNQGLAEAEGEFIICLNSDTIVTPNWADRLQECFKNSDRAGIVGPVTSSSAGRQQVGDVVKNNATGKPLPLDSAAILWGNNNFRNWQEAGTLYGWCLFISREFLAGEEYLFDPIFSNAYEDNDLCLRAQLKGFKLYIDFGTFIWHEGQASFRKQENFLSLYIENGKKNHELFLNKYRTDKPKKLVAVYRIANCEKYLAKSLEQTSKFADEIICLFARSQDRTKEIALSFPKVVAWEEWTEPDHPFDEQAERNWLLQKAIERGADWVISIDGDEVYEDKFVEMVPALLNNPNPHIHGYWCNWRTIWEVSDGVEKYRADSTFGQFQNYRFFKVLPGMAIKRNRNIYNHHCGSAPSIPAENLQWINVRVKHLGYDTEEQRKWKHEFYRKADPRPVIQDVGTADYHHLIEKNVQLKTYREKNRVSLMTICKNEGDLIYSMLSNVESVVDEIVIVDTGSDDNTLDEIRRFAKSALKPVRIFEQKFEMDADGYMLNYSEAKNWAKKKCRYEWILSMDADEMFDPREIGNIFGFIDEDCPAFIFNVINYLEPFVGTDISKAVYSISETIRLFRNIDEMFYSGLIHESLEDATAAYLRRHTGKIIQSPILLHHRGYLKKKEYIRKKVDRYHVINQKQFEVSGGQDPRPLFNMAMHLMNDEQPEEAIALYEKCLELAPSFWRAKHNIAWHHLEKAKKCLNECVNIMPAIYQNKNTKVREIIDMLNKFEFKIKKIC